MVYRPVVGCQTNCAVSNSKLTFTKYNGNGFSWLAIDSGVMLGGSVICRSYSGCSADTESNDRKHAVSEKS